VLTPSNLRRIKRYHHGKQRRSIRKCVRHMKHKHGVVLSRSTVQQALVDHLGLYPYCLKRAPMLNSVRKARRLEVATQFLNSHKRNPWRYWAITDEKRFNSEPKPNSHNDVIWDDQPDDDKHYCPRSKYGGHSVEVWGCLTWFGKPPLIFIERPLMLRNGRQVKQPFRAPDYVAKILSHPCQRSRRSSMTMECKTGSGHSNKTVTPSTLQTWSNTGSATTWWTSWRRVSGQQVHQTSQL